MFLKCFPLPAKKRGSAWIGEGQEQSLSKITVVKIHGGPKGSTPGVCVSVHWAHRGRPQISSLVNKLSQDDEQGLINPFCRSASSQPRPSVAPRGSCSIHTQFHG